VDLVGENALAIVPQKCRNMIRKADKRGVEVKIDYEGEYTDEFYRIYRLTMERNNAASYYYFSIVFFREMIKRLHGKCFSLHAFMENNIIATALFLYSDQYVHYHFSGTDPGYYHLSANNLILSSAIQWGLNQGKLKVHLGGGFTDNDDDTLLAFKKSFSKGTLCEFYVGKKIHDIKTYDALCKERAISEESTFFPLYRAT